MKQSLMRISLVVVCAFFSSSLIGQKIELDDTPLNPQQEKMYKEISDDLRCPTCTGLSTLQSNEAFSVQIRNAVRKQVLEGKNRDDIMNYFTERYGYWIMREPPKEGFHLFAWLIPGLMLAFGPFLIWFFVWRRSYKVSTFGVRSTEAILAEMDDRLSKLKTEKG